MIKRGSLVVVLVILANINSSIGRKAKCTNYSSSTELLLVNNFGQLGQSAKTQSKPVPIKRLRGKTDQLLPLGPETCAKCDAALKCYECTRPKGQGLPCEVNVESVQQTTCPTGFSCIKYVWTNTGSSVIYRHCTTFNCEYLQQNSTQFNTLESCQVCDTDLCNNALLRQSSLFLIILLYIISCHIVY